MSEPGEAEGLEKEEEEEEQQQEDEGGLDDEGAPSVLSHTAQAASPAPEASAQALDGDGEGGPPGDDEPEDARDPGATSTKRRPLKGAPSGRSNAGERSAAGGAPDDDTLSEARSDAGGGGGSGDGDKYGRMSAGELRQELRTLAREHAEQMHNEERARLELEDMLLRIEKHFKAEKAARQKAEQLMQQSIEAEMNVKSQLEEQQHRFKDMDAAIESDREALGQERSALESMRMDFEQELSAAQHEVGLAQEALKTAEDRVRAAEMVEKQKIIADYEQRLHALTTEMMRMREEMQQRTTYMQREMQRYQAAAMATAQAMASAKKEVGERRKEIDATRTKMDNLMERLYTGHEHNLTLQANITTAQDHAGQLFTDNFMLSMMGAMGLPDPGMLNAFTQASGKPAKAGGKRYPAPASARPKAVTQAALYSPSNTLPPIAMPKALPTSRLHQPTAATKAKRMQARVKGRELNDRFHGSKARNDNNMAAVMANW